MTLHPVYGHDDLKAALSTAVEAGSLPASLLLHGQAGVGKQRMSLWIARLLLCQDRQPGGPCGECHSCRLALRLEHPDVHWHFPLPRPKGSHSPDKLAERLEEARSRELAEIREAPLRASVNDESRAHYLAAARTIRRNAHRRPTMSEVQVFIIGDAEMLVPQESSPEAANSLLKLLEEPPAGAVFVLTSSEPGRVLTTIRSRCLPMHLPPLDRPTVERFLQEVAETSRDEAERAARLSNGSIGRALGFLEERGEPGPSMAIRDQALALVEGAFGEAAARFAVPMGHQPAGARSLVGLLDFVEEIVRDLAALASGAGGSVVHADRIDRLTRLADGASPLVFTRGLQAIEDAREEAFGNVNPQLLILGMLTALRRAREGVAA